MFRENLGGNLGGRKRRDRLYIMAEILEIARNGCLKTQIMYRANLSFAQLNEYMNFLLEVGLLKKTNEENKTVYRTTRSFIVYMFFWFSLFDNGKFFFIINCTKEPYF